MAVFGAAQLGAILTILQVIKIRIFSEHSPGWHLTRWWCGDTVLVIWSRRQGMDGGWVRNPTLNTHSPEEFSIGRYSVLVSKIYNEELNANSISLAGPRRPADWPPPPPPGCLENGRNVIFHRSRGRSNFYTSGKCGVNIMCAGLPASSGRPVIHTDRDIECWPALAAPPHHHHHQLILRLGQKLELKIYRHQLWPLPWIIERGAAVQCELHIVRVQFTPLGR